MRVGEIRQFCRVGDEGVVLSLSKHQRLMRAAMTQLNLSATICHRPHGMKLTYRITDLAKAQQYRLKFFVERL
jgi:hypothetical protein